MLTTQSTAAEADPRRAVDLRSCTGALWFVDSTHLTPSNNQNFRQQHYYLIYQVHMVMLPVYVWLSCTYDSAQCGLLLNAMFGCLAHSAQRSQFLV